MAHEIATEARAERPQSVSSDSSSFETNTLAWKLPWSRPELRSRPLVDVTNAGLNAGADTGSAGS